MKRDDIAKIFEGATDEQISAVLNINSADIGKVKGKLESERDTYKSQLETATAQLKGFEGVNVEELNGRITELNKQLADQKAAFDKQLAGDDTVTARKLYSEEFEFKPEFKLWIATNHKPIIRGTDTGIWRRIHIIPFNVQIPDEKVDKNLTHKLKPEMTAIFRRMLDGCALWQKEGLKMPRAVLDCVREYRREMDVISAFIEDCCVNDGSVAAKTLYAAYCQWADDNNEYRMSNTKFGSHAISAEQPHSRSSATIRKTKRSGTARTYGSSLFLNFMSVQPPLLHYIIAV